MSEYSHSMTIQADPKQVFNFVSDPRNLPKYMPTIQSATPQPGGRIRVIGKIADQHYDHGGRFYVDDAHRKMEWSFDDERKYGGWLEVRNAAGGHESELAVHILFESRQETANKSGQQMGDRDRSIQETLENALEAIKNIVEGRGSRVTSKASGR